jgi:hypothetical protein
VTDIGKFAVFRPVSNGYVYRAPKRRLFGSNGHYLVNEDQKTQMLAIYTLSTRAVLWLFYTTWVASSFFLGGGSLLWAYRSGYHDAGLTGILVALVVSFSIYPASLLSRRLLLRRLRPILDVLPPATERITSSVAPQISAKSGHVATISPGRRTVLRIGYVILVAGSLGSLIARTIDMHAMDPSMLSALYNANANFSGLLNVATIGLFISVLRREESRT